MKSFFILLISFLLLHSLTTYGQQITFEYNLSSRNDEHLFDLYEDTNGEIYFCGGVAPPTNIYSKSMLLVKLDKFGNEIKNNVHTINNRSLFAVQLLQQSSDSFVIAGASSDTLETRNEIAFDLYNMDLSLNLSNETHYHFDSIYIFANAYSKILSNGNIISFISKTVYPQSPRNTIYLFSDSFDSLDSKHYPTEARMITHAQELSNNRIWTLDLLRSRYQLLDSSYNIIDTQKHLNFMVIME